MLYNPEFFKKNTIRFTREEVPASDFIIMCAFLVGQYETLWNAVKACFEQKGSDACSDNDLALWKLLDPSVQESRTGKDQRCIQCGCLEHWEEKCDFLSRSCISLSKQLAACANELADKRHIPF